MSEQKTDLRRKLTPKDYVRIRYEVLVNDNTIRSVSNAYNVSTKYTKRLLMQTTAEVAQTILCSGCGFGFTQPQLTTHWDIWTSGGMHDLTCGTMAP